QACITTGETSDLPRSGWFAEHRPADCNRRVWVESSGVTDGERSRIIRDRKQPPSNLRRGSRFWAFRKRGDAEPRNELHGSLIPFWREPGSNIPTDAGTRRIHSLSPRVGYGSVNPPKTNRSTGIATYDSAF